MEKQVSDAYVAMILKNVFNKTNECIQNEAIVSRALADKITSETINQKVNNQMNAISIGIRNINSKFNEKSKNYDITKAAILDTLTNYEAALYELGQFYDGKIEQLILRKVELESHLIGSIIRDEYLFKKEEKKIEQKENDKVKEKVSITFNEMIKKISNTKKENNQIDVNLISKIQDSLDIGSEIDKKLSDRVQKTKNEEIENSKKIKKIEKEISLINEEIKRINERKKENLFSAMEVGNKWIATTIKKPKPFTKIKRFFSSKFNTPKLVAKVIIEPLNQRIQDFINNDLVNIKG